MSTAFVLLLIISFGFLCWGVIAPKSLSRFSKKPLTRKEAGIGFGVISFVLIILVGITAPDTPKNAVPATQNQGTQSKVSSNDQTVKKAPVITTETKTETETIPFSSSTVNDSSLTKGTTKVSTTGVNGVKTLTYEYTYTDGQQTDKKLVKEEVTQQPVNEIRKVGTKVASTPKPAPASTNCDPNYSGACVPIASDVDCASGSGNGPAYVKGPVKVIGRDIYDLDRDGDGWGCE